MTEPEHDTILDYAPAPRYLTWRTLPAALVGVGGYAAMTWGWLWLERSLNLSFRLAMAMRGVAGTWDWLVVPFRTVPPLVVMLALAWLCRSRAMLIASLITFSAALLNCMAGYWYFSGWI